MVIFLNTMIIEYLGTPVFYTTAGYGNPIVFLHGFLETSRIWEPLLQNLSNKRQVICIDLPGHGNTGNFGDVHPMELMAEVVHAVLDHLNISMVTLVGHSMGGYVSLAFTEKYPERISGLILMNSTPEADSEDRKIVRDRAVDLVKRNKAAYIKMAINNLVAPGNDIRFKKEIEEIIQEALKLSKNGIIAGLMGMKIRTNKINVLRQLTSHKIMISGIDDPLLPIIFAKNAAILSKCPIITVDGGHLSYIESYSNVREIVHFID